MVDYSQVKHLRKNILKLSQEEFAKNINISRSNLGNIETGAVKLTDRVIKTICDKYSVNEEWILNGTEPIFIEKTQKANEIAKLYEYLNEDNKKYLVGYIQRLLEEQEQSLGK